ncbi:MAG: PQQ-binding-like beta-propeller repeat protein [Ignavibacteriales bacterium]|nr:PQQ-binding-like beta-propeller repeat protein [Ignavibacteriales bacterium]MCF8314615.1 PQQ-binding-like beta-propeller repeat protein [Ignavibacteriales bacterium]MCF8436348.1 PQQ-binding-like beta-propeller repeat protein [Ignavibacteriales bacterium]
MKFDSNNLKSSHKMLFAIIYLILISAISKPVESNDYKFAWITDTHIGYKNADLELDSAIALINMDNSYKFVIVSGDITEKGKNEELEKAKEILDKLRVKYYVLPGNHDTKWSSSCGTKFLELWKDDKFSFEIEGSLFIGLNTGILWKGGGGHLSPEDISWTSELVSKSKAKDFMVFTHHPLDGETDNWFKLTNIFADDNVLYHSGHYHVNKLFSDFDFNNVLARSNLSKNNDSWGFTAVTVTNDSVHYAEVERDGIINNWLSISRVDTISFTRIDSLQYYSKDIEVNWIHDNFKSLLAPIEYYDSKILVGTLSGELLSYDDKGEKLWTYKSPGKIINKPVSADGIVAYASAPGDLITLDEKSGENIMAIGFENLITSGLAILDYRWDKRLMVPKESESQSAVLFATSDGTLHCYDLETLEQIWKNKISSGMIESTPLIWNDRIYFGAWDGTFYCVEAKTGLVIWKWSNNPSFYYSPAACPPVTDGRNIYFTTPDKKVHSIEMLIGKTNWTVEKTSAWESIGLSDDKKAIYIKGIDGKISIIDAKSGKIKKTIKAFNDIDTLPSNLYQAGDNIILASKNGHLYKIDKKFNVTSVLFLGDSRIHSLIKTGKKSFIAANMDGSIISFNLR